jgi:hypothetical protein
MTEVQAAEPATVPAPGADPEARLRQLAEAGILSWAGGKPTGAPRRIPVAGEPPLSQCIIEQRR